MLTPIDRDPGNQFAFYASHAAYSLRDATRALDALVDYLKLSKPVRAAAAANGADCDAAAAYLEGLRADVARAKARFELQVWGAST